MSELAPRLRHPEEPRILRGVSKDGRGRRRLLLILRGSPLRGERLRMTAEFFEVAARQHEFTLQTVVHAIVNVYLSPSPKPALSCACPVQRGGASRGVTEVGQSESWPEGQPDGRCGARGRASQARTREALGSRPGPLRGSAFNGWTGQVKGGVTCLDGEFARACARKLGPRDRNRCDGTLRGVPRPLVS